MPSLPERLKSLFWDYDFQTLSLGGDRDLIIARILTDGDWEAVRWLRQQIGDNELREWILRRQGRGLDARRLRFWEHLLKLPPREVNRWIERLKEDPWHQRTRK